MIARISSHFHRFMSVQAIRQFIHIRHGIHGVSRPLHEPKQLLVDVSVISKIDAGTGIQRVVRSILKTIFDDPPTGYRICPVAASRKQGYHYTNYVPGGAADLSETIRSGKVHVAPGDIFLGLDLAANILPFHHAELTRWKQKGARLHFLVYDLLPVLHSHWFNPRTTINIRRWLKTVAIYADSCICISDVVKDDLYIWMKKQYGIIPRKIPVTTISLGCDIEASAPSQGISEKGHLLESTLAGTTCFLMVGTLEPRKGHRQVISAFENLWQKNVKINLIIVGKPGWKTEELQKGLNNHPEKNSRLYWLQDASDEMVQKLYKMCSGVIVASEAEGFGLPLLEASFYSKPVLARDIPVFREIAGKNVTYFSGDTAGCLEDAILNWSTEIEKSGPTPPLEAFPNQRTWGSTGKELIKCLQNQSYDN